MNSIPRYIERCELKINVACITVSIVLLDDLQSVLRNVQTDPKLYWFCECLEFLVQNTESQLWRD